MTIDRQLTEYEKYLLDQHRRSVAETDAKRTCPECGGHASLSRGHSRTHVVCDDRKNCGWTAW